MIEKVVNRETQSPRAFHYIHPLPTVNDGGKGRSRLIFPCWSAGHWICRPGEGWIPRQLSQNATVHCRLARPGRI